MDIKEKHRGLSPLLTASRGIYLLSGLLTAIVFFVFKDFLLFKNLYLFKDIGSDSINLCYTSLFHLSQYARVEGLPGWTFNIGMGQNIFSSLTGGFMGLSYLLPPGDVAYGLIYIETIKVFSAGMFFYLYLRTLSLSLFSCIVGGTLFSFTGYIILGSCWQVFSSEAVFAAVLLYSFELYFKEHKWFIFPIAVALLGAHHVFWWFSYTIFLFIYATARFFQDGERRAGGLPAFYLKLMGLGLLGVAISALFSFSAILQILHSPRVGGEASYFSKLAGQFIFKTASQSEFVSAIGRSFSSDMLGTGSYFMGYQNYLEAPVFYCGLVSLLLAPQIFYFFDKRRKLISGFVILLCALPIIFPFFRWAFWGFAGDYYRTLSLVIVLFMLWFAMQALSAIDKTGRLSHGILAGTMAALLIALFFPYSGAARSPIDPNLRYIAAGFLAGYAVLTYLMGNKKYKLWAQIALLAGICVELAYFSSITINKRSIISAEELRSKTGYNDHSVDAVAWLNSTDQGFFRVDKTYSSGPAMHTSLNDAQVQGYNGTASYTSFNQLYYVKFLGEMGVIDPRDERQTRWIRGLASPFRALLLSFASVKYVLTRPGIDLSGIGYKLVNKLNNVSVFENTLALPLGFTYDKYVPYESFKTLGRRVKDQTLLRAFVAGAGDIDVVAGLEAFDPITSVEPVNLKTYSKYIGALKEEVLVLAEHKQNRLAGDIEVKKKKLLFFSIPYDKGWKAKVNGQPAGLKLVNIGFMGLPLEPGKHRVELEFTPPMLYVGALVSALGLLIYGFLLWRWEGRERAHRRRVLLINNAQPGVQFKN